VILALSCDNREEQPAAVSKQEAVSVTDSPSTDVKQEPAGPEIESTDPRLQKKNGRFSFEGSPFTGSATERYADGTLKNRISYREGLKDGLYQAWWPGGGSRLLLHYKRGRKGGLQEAWWENGNRRYIFTTFPGGPEGKKEEWYETGQRYRLMNYKGGREDGLQLGWFRDGKRHFNYVYRDGRRYGLPGKRLCQGGE
jgi:antitoxin component YwqK of YwqJK toxin-antitoxin module